MAVTLKGQGTGDMLTQCIELDFTSKTIATITLWTVTGAGVARTKNYNLYGLDPSGNPVLISSATAVPLDNKVVINKTDNPTYQKILLQPTLTSKGFFYGTSPVNNSDTQAQFSSLVTSWGNPPSSTTKRTEDTSMTVNVVMSGGGGMS